MGRCIATKSERSRRPSPPSPRRGGGWGRGPYLRETLSPLARSFILFLNSWRILAPDGGDVSVPFSQATHTAAVRNACGRSPEAPKRVAVVGANIVDITR